MEWLRSRAAATGNSVGAVIRAAIDRDRTAVDDELVRRRAALESFLSAEPLPVGTPEELKRELREMWDEEID
jgi:hypothetical protein